MVSSRCRVSRNPPRQAAFAGISIAQPMMWPARTRRCCTGSAGCLVAASHAAIASHGTCDMAADRQARGVGLVVLKQDIHTTSATGRLVSHILAAIDEWQRELIVEGTHEGLAAARARGRIGGRKPKLPDAQVRHARQLYDDGRHTVADIAKLLGVSRQTIYRALEPDAVET
jgi:hypothetical protein